MDWEGVVDPTAEIGPVCVIDSGVRIGPGTRLGPYVHIQGLTEIGPENSIGSGSTIGLQPQHLSYGDTPTRLVIGRGNTIREYVSIHRAMEEEGCTVIGDDCLLMCGTHVAHDCRLSDGVIMANAATLSGHVEVGPRVFISGGALVHQFVRIGRLAMISGHCTLLKDAPPFMIYRGYETFIRCLNTVGLRRAGLSAETRMELKRLFKTLYRSDLTPTQAIAQMDRDSLCEEGRELVDFYAPSQRGITGYEPWRPHGARHS